MAASLSEEEFQRLQVQLLELRSNSYSYEEKFHQQNTELNRLKSHIENLEKELTKAQKALNRSKRAKDIEQLIQDNENLQRKLQNQEDEFRLQNTTLMQELSSLVSSNEELEKELNKYRLKNDGDLSVSTDEIRRLQAEKAALQKSLLDAKNRYEADLLTKGSPPREESHLDDSTLDDDQKLQAKELSEVKLLLYTELEEKKILKEQLESLGSQLNEKIKELDEENKKITERLKKKQESILQLQEEKETLFTDNRTILEELEALKSDLELRQSQWNKQEQSHLEFQEKAHQTQQALQQEVNDLNTAAREQTQDAILVLETKVSSLGSELDRVNSLLSQRLTENKLLQCHLEDSQSSQAQLEERLKTAEDLKTKAEQVAMEAVASAEKRKCLLDQMAVHLQAETEKHKGEMEAEQVKSLEQLAEMTNRYQTQKELNEDLCNLESRVREYERETEEANRRAKELEDELSEERNLSSASANHFESCLEQKVFDHGAALHLLQEEHARETQLLCTQLEELKSDCDKKCEIVTQLEQDIKDSKEELRIQEKKGLSMVKELKKQLIGERRRADKLQERLQDYLSETSSTKIEDIVLPSMERPKGDTSSVSSWSLMSANLDNSKDGSKERISDEQNTEKSQETEENKDWEQESGELFARITQLQQEKWILEEKINHLEGSNAAMVEDIMAKTAIIQYYCMEGRADPKNLASSEKLTVKRIVDFIKDKGDENLREINRKLQRMLEETLSKNMFLQKDLEVLSNQVVDLRKMGVPLKDCASKYVSIETTRDT